MAIFRNVHVTFWTDSKIVDDFSPEDKYFYIYLLSNPHTNLCGCYEISMKQMSDELGYNKETIEKLIDRFHKTHKVLDYSKETKEMLLYNWSKYNWTKSPKFQTALLKEIPKVKCPIFADYLNSVLNGDTVSIPYEYGIDTTDTVTDTDTDTDSITITDTEFGKAKKNAKHKYGEYNNVLLTDDELDKLKSEFSDWSDRIERLSSYVASTGKSYKSHYATIRNWARKDQTTRPAHKGSRIASNERVDPIALKQMQRVMGRQELDRETLERWENNEPPTTAGNDENVRKRAEALRTQLGGGAYRER